MQLSPKEQKGSNCLLEKQIITAFWLGTAEHKVNTKLKQQGWEKG